MSWTAIGLCFLSPAILFMAYLLIGIGVELIKRFAEAVKDAKKGDAGARIILAIIFVGSCSMIGLWCLGWLK